MCRQTIAEVYHDFLADHVHIVSFNCMRIAVILSRSLVRNFEVTLIGLVAGKSSFDRESIWEL
jgi:hypothetical protein